MQGMCQLNTTKPQLPQELLSIKDLRPQTGAVAFSQRPRRFGKNSKIFEFE
jgi:hypothetical protein